MKTEMTIESLKNNALALEYLNQTLKFNAEVEFIIALLNVALAQGGISELSQKTNLCRESLYKTLKPYSNPKWTTVLKIIRAMGFDFKLNFINKSMTDNESFKRFNSFANQYPELAKEWNIKRNGKLNSDDVLPGSVKLVWWKCSLFDSHEWQSSCLNRIKGHNCPFCNFDSK